jgi:hypothetical protein
MRITPRLAIALCVLVPVSPSLLAASDKPAQKPETPHLDFVTEFIRELSATEDIRASGEQD